MFETIISILNAKFIIKIILLLIILDTILGAIRAIRDHEWNSTFGINGILRKSAIIICAIFFAFVDYFMNIDLLFFIPKEITGFIHLDKAGITEAFGIMFALYEATSILKNMVLCELPVPIRIKKALEKLLKDMTTELDKTESDKKEG